MRWRMKSIAAALLIALLATWNALATPTVGKPAFARRGSGRIVRWRSR